MPALVWLRRDIRLEDNAALYNASQDARDGLIAVYFITPKTWQRHVKSSRQLALQMKFLADLSQQLEKLNIALLIESVPTFTDSIGALKTIVTQHQVSAVYSNIEYEVDELARDQAVKEELAKLGCQFHQFHDRVLVPPEQLLNKQGLPYKVFTPYSKAVWQQLVESVELGCFPRPKKQGALLLKPSAIPKTVAGFDLTLDIEAWCPTFSQVEKRLQQFCAENAQDYKRDRDFPGLDGTSMLSPYFAIGALSVRQAIAALLDALECQHILDLKKQVGSLTWFNELIWREFYTYILWHFPQVCKNQAFKPETDRLPWREEPKQFQAWCEGRTGFPLIDAGMRQLNQTGWMHNRVRMVVAMFLTKTLFMSWRLGERYFAEQLIDHDFASNNGGWQWSASTGTDAAPYFRIFNPTTQSEKFDPDGEYIRHYCPEYKAINGKALHQPKDPIVDYKRMRQVVIEAFKAL